jgi:hypothetical protein
MRWLGPGCLHLGDGKLLEPGSFIPKDLFSEERLAEFEAKGFAEKCARDAKPEQAPPKQVELKAPLSDEAPKKKKGKKKKNG